MKTIQVGYTAFNGHVFSQEEADAYNNQCAFTEEARIKLEACPKSISCRASYELRVDLQSKLFKSIIGAI